MAGLELIVIDRAILELMMIFLPLPLEHWGFRRMSLCTASFTVFNVHLLLTMLCVY